MRQHGKLFFFFFGEGGVNVFLYSSIITLLWRDRLIFFTGNKHLDNMANCPAKAAYGFMDLDTRTAKWDSFVFYWLVIICLMIGWFSLWTLHGSRTEKWDPSWKASKNKTSSYDHWSLIRFFNISKLVIARYFNIPLRMKDDPFRLIGVIGSIQVRRLVMGLQNIWSSIPWNRDIVTLFHSVTLFQAQRFVTGALQLYPNHTENLLRSFWMRSWGEKIMNLLLRTSTLKSKYVVFHRWG